MLKASSVVASADGSARLASPAGASPPRDRFVFVFKPDTVVFLGSNYPDDSAAPLLIVEYKRRGGSSSTDMCVVEHCVCDYQWLVSDHANVCVCIRCCSARLKIMGLCAMLNAYNCMRSIRGDFARLKDRLIPVVFRSGVDEVVEVFWFYFDDGMIECKHRDVMSGGVYLQLGVRCDAHVRSLWGCVLHCRHFGAPFAAGCSPARQSVPRALHCCRSESPLQRHGACG